MARPRFSDAQGEDDRNLGIIFTGGGMTIADMTRVAQAAEAAGFGLLAVAEAWRSAWVPLTAMAAATERVRLAPYVVNAYGHSPLFTGMAAIDFADFVGSRLVLGVGGGNRIINEQWQGIPHARVLTKMREYVTLLQHMARTPAGARLSFEGAVHHMDWTPSVPPPAQPFPVYLAAVFPRMLDVAAAVADGIAGGATLGADYLRDTLRPHAARAAEAAGRDPATLAWSAVAITAVDEDRQQARRWAREALCHLYAPLPHPYYEHTMREQGFGAVADALLDLAPAGDLDAACAAIPDDCIDALTIAGTAADCRARVAAYDGLVDHLLLLNARPPQPGAALAGYTRLLTLARR
ncbi:MAG: LLM class flavin-dependent oxidoreductase [Gammaproteobacteria bacterium]